MKKLLFSLGLLAALAVAQTALAAERTVTFVVDNMYCASCPYIVKEAMAAVPGVIGVVVSFETKTATVTFDDAKTNADAIAAASTQAGYLARLARQGS